MNLQIFIIMKIIISESQYNKLISNIWLKESVESETETGITDFEGVYKDCYPTIFKQVCLKYSNNDYEQAQDFCQDGFIKAYQKKEQFTGTNPCAWISSIVRNNAIDELRKLNRQGKKIDLDKTNLGAYDANMDDDNDEFYSQKYSADDLRAAIETLKPGYRGVFTKYYLEDKPHQQVADELGINIGTSKSNSFKAKKKVLDYLKKLKRD